MYGTTEPEKAKTAWIVLASALAMLSRYEGRAACSCADAIVTSSRERDGWSLDRWRAEMASTPCMRNG